MPHHTKSAHAVRRVASVACIAASLTACGDKLDHALPCASMMRRVTYADVAPIFEAHCTSCHAATSQSRQGAPNGVNFDTYDAAAASAQRAASRVGAGTMPPRQQSTPVSEEDACVLQAWVDGGILE